MRGRGVLAQIFGLTPKETGEDAALLLTERLPVDWWNDHAIWFDCGIYPLGSPASISRPEWNDDTSPWPIDVGSALC